jgi:hypothetical protein
VRLLVLLRVISSIMVWRDTGAITEMLSIIIIINLVQKPVARMRRAGDSPGGRGAKRNQRKSRDVSRVT